MFQNLSGWIRLALVVSGLWIVGMSLYAVFSWKNPVDVPSPFVDYYYTTMQDYFVAQIPVGTFRRSFDGLTFAAVMMGGLAAAWLITVGVAWAIRGIKAPASSRLPVAGSQQGL
jgi:hypothetical protein